LKERIRETCETHVRYGYRRVYYILRHHGWGVNMKKAYRLYKELSLQLRNERSKRRVKAKLREDRSMAIRPNDVWAMFFIQNQLATGRKLRILTVVDTFSRLSPVIDPRFSYRGKMWSQRLKRLARRSTIQRRYGWTMAASSSRETWIGGLTSAVLPWTSFALVSPQITCSSKRSTASNG